MSVHCCHVANGSDKYKVAYCPFPIPMLHLVSGDMGLFRGGSVAAVAVGRLAYGSTAGS